MTVLVFMDNVPKGCRIVPTHVSSENEAEPTEGKFQITLSAVTPPLNVTVCAERERGATPPTLMTTTAPAGAWTEMFEAAVSCPSVRSNTSSPGYQEVRLRVEVPVARFVTPRAAKFDEAAARSESASGKEMGSDVTCVKGPGFPDPGERPHVLPVAVGQRRRAHGVRAAAEIHGDSSGSRHRCGRCADHGGRDRGVAAVGGGAVDRLPDQRGAPRGVLTVEEWGPERTCCRPSLRPRRARSAGEGRRGRRRPGQHPLVPTASSWSAPSRPKTVAVVPPYQRRPKYGGCRPAECDRCGTKA